VATSGVILAALYLLWAYQRVFHGEPDEDNKTFPELKLKEGMVLLPFIAAIVFVGVYPKPMLDRIEPSVKSLITHGGYSDSGSAIAGSDAGAGAGTEEQP
jgi:NADH-quinone oxidoreductase subunit M